jgi:predicted MarR family transcription regulator
MPHSSVNAGTSLIAESDTAKPVSTSNGNVSLQPASGDNQSVALTEFEFGAVGTNHAFHRWMVSCMAAAGLQGLTVTDVLVLHHINHRAREKRLAEICFILNIEDTHIVAYSLRKLVTLAVVRADKHGKEVAYSTTPLGQEYLSRYREIREQHLLDPFDTLGLNTTALEKLAPLLRKMSGLYDQAARAASSL